VCNGQIDYGYIRAARVIGFFFIQTLLMSNNQAKQIDIITISRSQYGMMLWKGGMGSMNGTKRIDIKPGLRVSIVMKADQNSGKLTEGVVKDILTNSSVHPHGIKVRLENGLVGRVKEIK
jgi:uncharacterized repeat protein (TIGR03833 family)